MNAGGEIVRVGLFVVLEKPFPNDVRICWFQRVVFQAIQLQDLGDGEVVLGRLTSSGGGQQFLSTLTYMVHIVYILHTVYILYIVYIYTLYTIYTVYTIYTI